MIPVRYQRIPYVKKSTRLKIDTDIRKYTAPGRGSESWKKLYKQRTVVERVNAYLKEFFQVQKYRTFWTRNKPLALLFALKIPHDKEPQYPEGNYRADFKVNDVFIEFFGLAGNKEYDERTKYKQKLCKKYGIQLISLYPSNLVSTSKLPKKILKGLSLE